MTNLILIVEDEMTVRKFVHAALVEAGYDLLALLVRNTNRLLTDRFLTTQVWGDNSGRSLTQLRLTIAVLRRKLEQNPTMPRHLLTEQGVGYRFSDQ